MTQTLLIYNHKPTTEKEHILQNFKNLEVWKKSHALTLSVYESTSQFPREEIYGLTSQIRRACASIPTNIAEGSGRGIEVTS